MNLSRRLLSLAFASLLPGLARADELFVASPTTLIQQGNPYTGELGTIGVCGGPAHSMTLDGDRLLIGDPSGHVYVRNPGDLFVSYAYDVPNDAQALAMHGGDLLSAGSDMTLVRVDSTTGAVLATFNLSVPATAMTVSGDDVYVGSSFGVVFKGDATSGGFQFWGTCGGPVNSLAIDATHLNLGTTSGDVYRLDLSNQQVTETYHVASDAEAMLVHADDLLIGGSDANILRVRRTDGLVKSTIAAGVPVSALAALAEADPGTIYCYGVGCPCGNDDADGGCQHQHGYGARLAGSGTASVAADDLELFVFGLPPNKAGRFYMSQSSTQLPFGNGLLCAASSGYPLFRFPFLNSGPTASLRLPQGLVAWCSTHFASNGHIFPAATWHFQVWYRDPPGPCTGYFNTSNSYAVTFSN